MDLRLTLYQLAARHRLDARQSANLQQLAGLYREPAALAWWLPRGLAIVAAALFGMGVIFWIAANWDTFGRVGRFALLQGFVVIMCLGALARPAARAPLGLLALLATGALFAYFGQTYQTGADPWQLFALWAALALPLCLGARSDVLWLPWALVAATAIALWVHAHAGHRWGIDTRHLSVHAIGWSAALALIVALGPIGRPLTGAGVWSLRASIVVSVIAISTTALAGLFFRQQVAPHYWLGLAMLLLAAAALSLPRLYDIFVLSAVGLALDTLLLCGLGRLLSELDDNGLFWLLLGLAAAGLLALTVSLILRLARRQAQAGATA